MNAPSSSQEKPRILSEKKKVQALYKDLKAYHRMLVSSSEAKGFFPSLSRLFFRLWKGSERDQSFMATVFLNFPQLYEAASYHATALIVATYELYCKISFPKEEKYVPASFFLDKIQESFAPYQKDETPPAYEITPYTSLAILQKTLGFLASSFRNDPGVQAILVDKGLDMIAPLSKESDETGVNIELLALCHDNVPAEKRILSALMDQAAAIAHRSSLELQDLFDDLCSTLLPACETRDVLNEPFLGRISNEGNPPVSLAVSPVGGTRGAPAFAYLRGPMRHPAFIAGCFKGSAAKLLKASKDKHGPKSRHYRHYRAFVAYGKGLLTPETVDKAPLLSDVLMNRVLEIRRKAKRADNAF